MTGPLTPLLDEIDDVVAAFRRAGSRAGYFPAMYRCVTLEVARRCAAGQFEEPDRMVGFTIRFARQYLDAVEAHRTGKAVPEAWSVAFTAADAWRPVVLQHLMLGMNAHINLDLGVVAAELAGTDGLDAIARDFRLINEVLAAMTIGCQRAVGDASPWIGLLDRIGGRTDTRIVRFSLVRAREAAWNTAERLAPLGPVERAKAVTQLDRDVAALAPLVLDAPVPIGVALFAVRLRERRPVPDVIDRLTKVTAAL